MLPEMVQKLLDINKQFYAEFAEAFAETRSAPQPGFSKLLNYLPKPCYEVVDVGCGNGRFGLFLSRNLPDFSYTGIDFTVPFLDMASASLGGKFITRDISQAGFLEGQGQYDLAVCLATLQHIPGRPNRLAVLREMAAHLTKNGRLFLSNWQFVQSDRQKRKILDWSEVGIKPKDVDPGDYLLSWHRNGRGRRYVHLLDQQETAWLAKHAGLMTVGEYHDDGKEGDLNLYTILARQQVDT
jgi:tRNA (uracil-5-)-methyltransferase TRM9